MPDVAAKVYEGLKPGDCLSRFDPNAVECRDCMVAMDCKVKTIERRKKNQETVAQQEQSDKLREEEEKKKQEEKAQLTDVKKQEKKINKQQEKLYKYMYDRLGKKFSKHKEEVIENIGVKHTFLKGRKPICVVMVKDSDKKMKVVLPTEEFVHEALVDMEAAKVLAKRILKACGLKLRSAE
jgi:hypothetical protein